MAYSLIEDNARVYVQPFPPTGEIHSVAETASNPVWSFDGRELFYLSRVLQVPRLSSVKVVMTPALTFTSPTSLELTRFSGDPFKAVYDVLSDGHFIYPVNVSDAAAPAAANPPIQVVLNWFEELKQRVPVK